MRRLSRAGGDPTKAQRRKTAARKSRIAPKAVHPRSSSAARQETKVARLTRELREAREQPTSEVLLERPHCSLLRRLNPAKLRG
jgi:hypothetical protein